MQAVSASVSQKLAFYLSDTVKTWTKEQLDFEALEGKLPGK